MSMDKVVANIRVGPDKANQDNLKDILIFLSKCDKEPVLVF